MKCLCFGGIFYFVPMALICLNGLFFPADAPLFPASNRAFKYGDGVFETARFMTGKLLLADLHFGRLFDGLQLLQIDPAGIDQYKLMEIIGELCNQNGCFDSARVRLQVFRDGNRGAYSIEAEPIAPREAALSVSGYRIGVFPDARKGMDAFANLKSANYLPYVMADLYAQANRLDEAVILNTANHICDGSKTNIFLVKDGQLRTPSLDQGCVAGVMRRHVIETLRGQDIVVEEGPVSESCLLKAEAVFLTNAIRGIGWVKSFRDRNYTAEKVMELYRQVF
jgi:branched-chain amino acid aminotransferase